MHESVASLTPSSPLLRVYWYDGVLRTGPTAEQRQLAQTDHVKLRLGVLAFSGRQKGVDSLIVTDLIELARNRAITDAILISGDEDVRVAVQVAQTLGVRIHLLGIEPATRNQSPLLRQEADTTREWLDADIARFLSISAIAPVEATNRSAPSTRPVDDQAALDAALDKFIGGRIPTELAHIASLDSRQPIPHELDRLLLTEIASDLGRHLEPNERAYARHAAKVLAGERTPQE